MTRTARSHPTVALAVVALLTLAGCAGSAEPGGATSSATGSTTEPSIAEPSTSPAPETPAPAETTPAETTGTTVITTPSDGATLAGPTVEVTGQGTAFEATLSWRVVTAGTDDAIAESFTMAGANGEIGPFAFTVELPPGHYTLEVWEPDMSDGAEGAATARANATFTLT